MFRTNYNSDTDNRTHRHAWSRSSSRQRPAASAGSRRRSRDTSSDPRNPSPSHRGPAQPLDRSGYLPAPPSVSYHQSHGRGRSTADSGSNRDMIEVVLDEFEDVENRCRRHSRGARHSRGRDRDREQNVEIQSPQQQGYMGTSFRARAAPSNTERPRSDLHPPTPTQVPYRPASRLAQAAFAIHQPDGRGGYHSDTYLGSHERRAPTNHPATDTARYSATGDTLAPPTFEQAQYTSPTLHVTDRYLSRNDSHANPTRPSARPPAVYVTPPGPVEEPSARRARTTTSTGEPAGEGTELIMLMRDMGIASDPRYDITVHSRKAFSYPSKEAFMLTSDVHFPMISAGGSVQFYKVCEHFTLDGHPERCKAFHSPVHPSSVSTHRIRSDDLRFYSAAIIPSDHLIFTHRPGIKVQYDHSRTYEELQNKYKTGQTYHAEERKAWMCTDLGKLRLSEERYFNDVNSNMRQRDRILRRRREEMERSSNMDDILQTIQNSVHDLNRFDPHHPSATMISTERTGHTDMTMALPQLNRDEELRRKLSQLGWTVKLSTAGFEDRTTLITQIQKLKDEVQQSFQSLRQSILNQPGQEAAPHSHSANPSEHPYTMALDRLDRALESALQAHRSTVNPLTWLEEDEERLRVEKEDLNRYYRSLEWTK